MKKLLSIILVIMLIQTQLLAQIAPIILKDIGEEKEQITRATIGAGNITIDGTQATDAQLAGLNRDTSNTQEVTKDMITGALNGSMTIDNRLLSEQGRASIVKDFTKMADNLEQIAENITTNNIIVQAISTALDDKNSLGLVDAVKQYLSLDGKTDKILDSDKLKAEINGATNLDPEKLKESFQQIAEIYNDNGEKIQGLEISNIEGNIAGLSYVDTTGQKQTITINLADVDITDPKAIASIIDHETTNIQSHHNNENNAENRGNMASAIMDMKNYGNENTNQFGITTQDWLNKIDSNGVIYANSETIKTGNQVLIDSILNHNSGNGTADASAVSLVEMSMFGLGQTMKLFYRAGEDAFTVTMEVGKDIFMANANLYFSLDEYIGAFESFQEGRYVDAVGLAAFGLAMDADVPGKIVKAVKLGYETAKMGKKVIDSGQEVKALVQIVEHSNSGVKKLTDVEIEKIAEKSTQNPNANKVMLGKFEGNSVSTSYQEIAKREAATYFQMPPAQWDRLSSLDQIRANNVFLRQQVGLNKDIYTSHSPLSPTGSFSSEIKELKNKYGIYEYKQINDLWKVVK